MKIGILEILCLLATSQYFLLALFLLTQRKGRRQSHRILAALFVSQALLLLDFLNYRLRVTGVHFYFILVPLAFLYGPLLFFYVKSLLEKSFSFRIRDFVHLLPVVLSAVFLTAFYHVHSAERKIFILEMQAQRSDLLTSAFRLTIAFKLALYLSIFAYIAASGLTLPKYRDALKNKSATINRAGLRLGRLILCGAFLIRGVDLSSLILPILGAFAATPPVWASTSVVLQFIFANVIVFISLRVPQVFTGNAEAAKYLNSKLSPTEGHLYLDRLLLYMQTEKPYLEPVLTITKLGKRLSISPRYLSQVINESLGTNFYDFVNGYRVEEAKRLLGERSGEKSNFLAVVFDSGFNTKSAFNRAFKKHSGMTPSQFRRLQKSRPPEWPSCAPVAEDGS